MAMREDLSAFFQTAEFAERAALTPAAGGLPIAGLVIYDQNGTVLGDFGVSTEGPACIFPAEQWPDAGDGDLLEIVFGSDTLPTPPRTRSYRVRSVQSLDDGAITLATLVRT